MSYEGYTRVLCAEGHLHSFDCYDEPELRISEAGKFSYEGEEYEVVAWTCPDCGSNVVWFEGVDQTNDSGWSTDLKIFSAAENKTCQCCKNVKKVKKESYYIPSNRGHRINKEVVIKVPLAECEYSYNAYDETDKPED